jgi:hypothetical protein
MTKSQTETIAELNDHLRRTGFGGHIYVTRGIADLPSADQQAILLKVRTFDTFTEDNDPYDEHDFGAFDMAGIGKIFWKIDYYGPDLKRGSEDPADPKKTARVLTIMLASEY